MCLLAQELFFGHCEQSSELTVQLLGISNLSEVSPVWHTYTDKPFVFIIIYIFEKLN